MRGLGPGFNADYWHGVTTALLGNCGVTFAPCKPGDRELLAGMMETVEISAGRYPRGPQLVGSLTASI